MTQTRFRNFTLRVYLNQLARREPVPGGGSAAALASALGVGLISMVANYSISKKKSPAENRRARDILQASEEIRGRLLELTEQDARAYLNVVRSWKKDARAQRAATLQARAVPSEVCRLSARAVDLTPWLVRNGNKHLLSDIEVALELLQAGFSSAEVMIKTNSL